MIIDGFLAFSTPAMPDNLALGTGTYNSNNVIDLGLYGLPLSAAGGGARDIGIGDDPSMKLFVDVMTAFTSGGAGTLQVILQGAPDSGAGAPGTWYTMLASQAIALSALVQGAHLLDVDVPRPPPNQPVPRYLRMQYTIGGAAMTAGQVASQIVLDRFDQINGPTGSLSGYPPGIAISN